MPASTQQRPSAADLRDIQGNLVGFNKDHQRLLFIAFPSPAAGKAFLTGMLAEINSAEEVKHYNDEYKRRQTAGEDPLSQPADWVNVAPSFHGLFQLQADGLDNFPPEFQAGMRARAEGNGDVDSSDPSCG